VKVGGVDNGELDDLTVYVEVGLQREGDKGDGWQRGCLAAGRGGEAPGHGSSSGLKQQEEDRLTFDKAFYWPDLRSGNKTYDTR
jgi:hypothetical protein